MDSKTFLYVNVYLWRTEHWKCWEWDKFAPRLDVPVKKKLFSFREGASPLTTDSASGPRWGLRPQTPVIGSRCPCRPPRNLWICHCLGYCAALFV